MTGAIVFAAITLLLVAVALLVLAYAGHWLVRIYGLWRHERYVAEHRRRQFIDMDRATAALAARSPPSVVSPPLAFPFRWQQRPEVPEPPP